ncbi:MAG TPA: ATP-binding protein [Capillimicrobium sp.]|nr:ATP-binding protein [Capillimicrobium sp.]
MPVRFSATFPGTPASVRAVRHAIAEIARRCGMSGEQVAQVRLAVSEAVSNAVIHAYAEREGDIFVDAHEGDGELVVKVADEGGGVLPRPDSPGLGLGLPLIVALTSRMEICHHGRRTEVVMAFDCPGARSRQGAVA